MVRRERVHYRGDDERNAEEEVVDEPEGVHTGIAKLVHFVEDVARLADGDARVGRDRGAADEQS
ncbi:hypothetical protein BS329_36850 [Amycolatopsis coloradensis]|uniref:Uncharacterized protein n=1 Tax=Amycolatopsis coloradensis TaxID=76021 RepID=A0A1R0KFY2_9PSEU|nr:hypothetical protein [Amycolatopsis coloradensis]OLZ44405.1 hypothetical protein BS329_36850 [Amycolatopsis coloradensis]